MKLSEKYIIYSCLYLSFVFFCGSCTKDIKVKDLPKIDPQPVVQCFLSPQDDTIHVYLYFSTPIFSENWSLNVRNSLLSSAIVTLSGGGRSVKLLNNFNIYHEYVYIIDRNSFPVVAGETYTLDCLFSNGMHTSAHCTIPLTLPKEVVFDNMVILPNRNIWSRMLISYHFTDDPGEGDYYFVCGIYLSEMQVNTTSLNYDKYWMYLEINQQSHTISDKDHDGSTFYLNAEGFGHILKRVKFRICKTDRAYYLYRKSLINYNENDPFAEPSTSYTNINNGLGVFAGFNMREQEIILVP